MKDQGLERPLSRLSTQVGQFDVSGKTLLLPRMSPFGSRLLAASFRAFGVDAVVMETYKGLSLGKEFTSGKECFPCQVTLGDVLHHLQAEQERWGNAFRPDRYVYFLPEADGPCRFGMYNKYQRLILDRFPGLRQVPIVYLTSHNGYAGQVLPPAQARYFRRVAYVATVIADVLERASWRVRPYEKTEGATDVLLEQTVQAMESLIVEAGPRRDFQRLYELLEDALQAARALLDTDKPRRPRIGLVGEIYLRTHPESNQDLARSIERFGGEVVIASVAEWFNYVTYDRAKRIRRRWEGFMKRGQRQAVGDLIRDTINVLAEKYYQGWRQTQVYRRALHHLDIEPDHTIRSLEAWLDNDRHFNFAIGTEAALSIGGALAYIHADFDGIVNVFPFTCMPSTICAAILKPLLHQVKIPYLDASYDGTIQPNRDVALRTFVYQASQHLEQRQNGERGI